MNTLKDNITITDVCIHQSLIGTEEDNADFFQLKGLTKIMTGEFVFENKKYILDIELIGATKGEVFFNGGELVETRYWELRKLKSKEHKCICGLEVGTFLLILEKEEEDKEEYIKWENKSGFIINILNKKGKVLMSLDKSFDTLKEILSLPSKQFYELLEDLPQKELELKREQKKSINKLKI